MRLGIASGDRVSPKKAHDDKEHWGGAGWARLAQYIPYFEEAGIYVSSGTLVWSTDRFVIDISDGDGVYEEIDVLYLQRLMHDGLATHINLAQKYGQVVINDLDDWYWGLSTNNLAFKSSHPTTSEKENTNHYKSVLNSSSLVTVSTAYLADRISSFVRCPIEIMPNYVKTDRFQQVSHVDSPSPTVGWVGSTLHRSGDLEILKGIISPMVNSGEIKFMHGGAHPYAPTAATALGIEDELVSTIPACDPGEYHHLLQMEIGIAPLNDMPFNHAKSDIKLLEYSSAGIPWIGSGLSAYTALQKEWGIGRVATRPKDWIKHINALRDYETRVSEGYALRELVKQRDIAVGAKNLIELLESVSNPS
jgi:glycosyltransferase involved in cell wall biosynthesis